jgi:hypothetical protein
MTALLGLLLAGCAKDIQEARVAPADGNCLENTKGWSFAGRCASTREAASGQLKSAQSTTNFRDML